MIGYVTVGTNDPERANAFYAALLSEIGAKLVFGDGHYSFYGIDMQSPLLAVCRPYNGAPHVVGNGAMVAFQMPDRATVDRLHARALELGGSDEGEPGLREPPEMQFYGAYFRDPEGNKLCVFRMGAA